MDEEPDATRLAAWKAFIFAHAAVIDRIEQDLAAAGHLPLTWYDVLTALSGAPDQRLRLRDLARAVVLSRSGLSRLIDRVEAAGLIRREPCPTDRRGAFAVLTAEGAATVRRTWPSYARNINEHFARHLSESEARVLAESLWRIDAAAREP